MFFEERNTKILCRRVKYVGDGKHKNETVTSFAKYARPVPAEVRDLLDAEELEQLDTWLKKRDDKTVDILDRVALDGLAVSLRRSINALEVPENVVKYLTEEKTAELWAELDEMRRALRKVRPKPKAVAKVDQEDQPE